jgi:Mg2+ and Co2+ transporter CorA
MIDTVSIAIVAMFCLMGATSAWFTISRRFA